jgi:DNA polymerase I
MRALVDTDVLVYQAASAATTIMEADYGDDLVLFPTVSVGEACTIFDHLVEQIRDMTEADELFFALSAPTNFRKTLYADYKANRKGDRPMAYGHLREHAVDKYSAQWIENLEGDDVIGINSGPGTIIWSIDKDMRTLPGLHLDTATGDTIEVTEGDALRNWMTQTLTGDSADNYPGCRGIGKVRAERLLEDVEPTIEAIWPVVVKAYAKAGQTEADAIVMAQLARILHPNDYQKGEIQLWTPTIQ